MGPDGAMRRRGPFVRDAESCGYGRSRRGAPSSGRVLAAARPSVVRLRNSAAVRETGYGTCGGSAAEDESNVMVGHGKPSSSW